MHAVKVDSRKIMAAGLVIVAVFAAVAITVNLFYLGQIQSLVRNTTTTSVMELATARARYLDECLTSDQNSVKSLAHFIADITPQEARDQVKDFISTHEAAAAWIRSKDGTTWCSSSETDLYDPALEDELFGPAMAGETGSSEMYLGHAGERRILFYAPIVDAPATAGPGTTTTPADPDDVLGAVYVSYPADELQNSYGTPIPAPAPPSSSTPPAPSCSTPTTAPTRRSRAAFRPSSTTTPTRPRSPRCSPASPPIPPAASS